MIEPQDQPVPQDQPTGTPPDQALAAAEEQAAPVTSLLTYGYSRGGALIKPEDEGQIKGLAIRAMEEQTQMHMDQIYEQMKLLASQAQDIQRRRELSERIYRATIRFTPLIGRTYFLYRNFGDDILSLIAPHEWGRSRGYEEYLAQIRLLADHTWEVLD